MLRVKGLSKSFGAMQALYPIDLTLDAGKTLAIVGESGSGKTTLGRCLMRLTPASSGQIFFRDKDILQLDDQQLRSMRRHMQIIFQDPYAALNPRLTIETILREPFVIHKIKHDQAHLIALLDRCGLPRQALARYPHEFSGGQRQRICIARALALEPELLICDEPMAALDVSIQAQIMNLLLDLQRDFGLSYIFISHDLKLVQYIAHSVGVLYQGRLIELGPAEEIFLHPRHAYTQALLSAIPSFEHRVK